jgi:hypothetical protein
MGHRPECAVGLDEPARARIVTVFAVVPDGERKIEQLGPRVFVGDGAGALVVRGVRVVRACQDVGVHLVPDPPQNALASTAKRSVSPNCTLTP